MPEYRVEFTKAMSTAVAELGFTPALNSMFNPSSVNMPLTLLVGPPYCTTGEIAEFKAKLLENGALPDEMNELCITSPPFSKLSHGEKISWKTARLAVLVVATVFMFAWAIRC